MKVRLRSLVGWSFSSTVLAAFTQLATFAIIARVLGPSDVGAAAILNVVVALGVLFQDFGFSNYLVHRQSTSPAEEKTLFAITVIIGAAVLGAVISLSAPLSAFYGEPRLAELVSVVAWTFLLTGLGGQFQAIMIREFRLALLAKIEMLSRTLGFLSFVGILVLWEGLNAFAYSVVVGSALRTILLIAFNRHHLRRLGAPSWCPEIVGQALRYGVFQVAAQGVNQFRTNLDVLVLGRVAGLELGGTYALAKELVLKPGRLTQPVVTRVGLPLYAKLQGQPNTQRIVFLRSIEISSAINGAIYAGLGLLAWPIVLVLYGDGYEAVHGLVAVLLLLGFLRTVGAPGGALAQANARTEVDFLWNCLAAAITAGALLIVGSGSIDEVALMMTGLQLVLTLLAFPLLVRPVSGVTLGQFLSAWYRSALPIIFVGAIAYVFAEQAYLMALLLGFPFLLLLVRRVVLLVSDGAGETRAR